MPVLRGLEDEKTGAKCGTVVELGRGCGLTENEL